MNSIQKCIKLITISLVWCQFSYAMFDHKTNQKKRKLDAFENELIGSSDDHDDREAKFFRYEEQPIDINDHIVFFSGYQPINQDQFQFVFNAAQAEDLEKSKLAHCPYAKISCYMLDEYYPSSCTHHRFDSCWIPEQASSRQMFWNELRPKPIQIIEQELFNYAIQNISAKKLELFLNRVSNFNDCDAATTRCLITDILEDVQNNFTAPEKFFLYNIHAHQNAKVFCQKISALTLNGYSTCLFKLLLVYFFLSLLF